MEFLTWFLVFITLIVAMMLCPGDAEGTRFAEKSSKKKGRGEKRRKKNKRLDFGASPVEGVAGKVGQLEGFENKDEEVEPSPEKVEFLGSQNAGIDDSCGVEECREDAQFREDNVAAGPESTSNYNDEDEEWEGVERSELEKVFAEAVNYVEFVWKSKDSDLQMLFYGLHKIGVEGPCHSPQPMALMISARAKWNAWNQLGSMSPEDAMGEYIKVLSEADPGWKQHFNAESNSQDSLQTAEGGHITS